MLSSALLTPAHDGSSHDGSSHDGSGHDSSARRRSSGRLVTRALRAGRRSSAVLLLACAAGSGLLGVLAPSPAAAADLPRLVGAPQAVVDTAGRTWASDRGFSGGRLSRPAPGRAISGTADDQLYRSSHVGMRSWSAAVPSGSYDVTLKFAEVYFSGPGKRVFSVTAEGARVVTDLDVARTAGTNAAYDRKVRVVVKDGRLDLGFSATVNLPMVSGIQVVAAPAATTSRTSGAPGAATTGVPDGTALTRHDGDLTISTPGAVVDGLDLHGFLTITAPDVTVTRSIIRGAATATNRSLVQTTGARVRITDSTLLPASPSVYVDGLKGYGFTATRLDISRTVDTALVYGSDTTIQDSWLHDNVHYASDPAQGGGPSHDDGIQVQGGNNIAILRNTVPGAYNSAVQVTQDTAVTSNLTIAGNWLGGGGCTVNIAQKARGPIQGLTLTDNHFSRSSRYDCGIIADAGNVRLAARNTWTDTGLAVAIEWL